VPDHSTLGKWEEFFGDKSLEKLHDKIIRHLDDKKIISGRKLRTDTTVAPAHIHYPTDASLLSDAVRVVARTVNKIQEKTKLKIRFRSRVKEVKNNIREMNNSLKKRSDKAKKAVENTTANVVRATEQTVEKARDILSEISSLTDTSLADLADTLSSHIGLAEKLIRQTNKRLNGEKITNRIVSFFQPSMRPIPKGKLNVKCEFGRKLQIDETEKGIISDWKIFKGNPGDTSLFAGSVDRHKKRFGRDPTVAAADRGFHSPENQEEFKGRIRRLSIPVRGKPSKQRLRTEKSKWFRECQNFRAGGEATISVLKRTSSVGRNKAKTEKGYTRSIGWAIISRNLRTISAITG
jgi:hypothetical protein